MLAISSGSAKRPRRQTPSDLRQNLLHAATFFRSLPALQVPCSLGVGHSRTDGVDQDAVPGDGIGKGPGHVQDGDVGHTQRHVGPCRAGPRSSGDVDDPPPPVPLHVRNDPLGQAQIAVTFQSQPLVDDFGREIQDIAHPGRTGAVHQDVHPIPPSHHFIHHLPASFPPGQVAGHRPPLTAGPLDLHPGFLQQGPGAGSHTDPGAFPGQRQGAAAADAAAGPGNDGSLAFQS